MKDRQEHITSLKIPPHSIEAEQAVLAAVMMNNNAFDGVADVVGAGDFYRKEHRLIWEAMLIQSQNGKPMDVITISEVLLSRKLLKEAGGIDYLEDLLGSNQSAANVIAYAKIVKTGLCCAI